MTRSQQGRACRTVGAAGRRNLGCARAHAVGVDGRSRRVDDLG